MKPRVISGGQTGVDRAALDAAAAAGLRVGGWCPAGRLAEDGVIPSTYPLRETPTADYAQRTEWNVRDADATLICCAGPPGGGTAFTWRFAVECGKPVFLVELQEPPPPTSVLVWLRDMKIAVLNVAGPRESQAAGIYQTARFFLGEVFREWSASLGSEKESL
ncbi:MAG TPA: putative molybdenum carrier protein [Acidobacteriota bacterium]|nr:putative molybdenum carrier protein [Acidobacteriota bacterium]